MGTQSEEKCPNYFIWGWNKQRWLKAERRVEEGGTEEEIAEEPGLVRAAWAGFADPR